MGAVIPFPARARSDRRDVRNPILALPAARAVLDLPPAAREALAALMYDLSRDALARGQDAWKRNKAPMAVYWRQGAANARHIARAIRSRTAAREALRRALVSCALLESLSRITEHLEVWARAHADEATTETWAAIHCARELIATAEASA